MTAPNFHTYDQHKWHAAARERGLTGPIKQGRDTHYEDADGKVVAFWNGTRNFGYVLRG